MTMTTIEMDQYKGTTTTEAVAEALAATRGQKRSGADVVTSHHVMGI
jgi:hypothetical protein